MEDSKQESSLAKTAFWLIAAKILSFGITFAIPLILARRLSVYNYGIYKQAFLLVATISSHGQFGFPMSSYYFFPRHKNHAAVVMNVFALKPSLAVQLTGSPEMERLAGLLGWTILFVMVSYFFELITVLNQEAKLASRIMVLSATSKGVLWIFAANVWGSVESLLWMYLLQGIGQTAFLLYYLNSRFPGFLREFDGELFRQQVVYCTRFLVSGLLIAAMNDLHSYVVGRRFGAEQFAIYAVGCLQIPLTSILTEAIGPLLIRQVNRLESEGKTGEIAQLLSEAARKLAMVFFPLAGCLMVVGREFLTILFTGRYAESYPVFCFNLLLIPLGIFLFDPVSRAFPQYQGTTLQIRVGLVLLLIGFLYVFLHWFGPVGAMMAGVATAIVERVLMMYFWMNVLEWPKLDRRVLRDIGLLLGSAIAAGLVALQGRTMIGSANPWTILVTCSMIYGGVYLGIAALTGIATHEERQWLSAKLGGVRV